MSMVGFPLLLIPLAIYNMIAFLMPAVGFNETLVQVRLVSGEMWTVSLGDILLALGVLLLWLEVIKAARPNGKYLTDHLLSFLVAAGAVAEFVMWPKFANSTFFLLALLATVDFFAGIGLRNKRRRGMVAVAASATSAPRIEPAPRVEPAPEPEPPAAEPELPAAEHADPDVAPAEHVPAASSEPAPAPATPTPATPVTPATPAVPAAAAVAESVLLDPPDPRVAVSAATEPPPKAGDHALPTESAEPASPHEPEPHEPERTPDAPKP
ncbi:hypothetical protein ACQR1W_12010 [Bradyrhizobium sp. HKCCYLS1011]|uniref:hypothetical protein n=1 Tax=Bradyrhizobium sp. HKCCYLS1011 TaxID=3420733 RepID=UPI003EBFF65E